MDVALGCKNGTASFLIVLLELKVSNLAKHSFVNKKK